MGTCSDDYPSTDVLYSEISSDVANITFMVIGSILTIACLLIFLEEVNFIHKVHNGNDTKIRKQTLVLGLYPVVCVMSLMAILVPTSTTLVELMSTCYLSMSIYTFVTMTVDHFGGSEAIVNAFKDDKFNLSTPPCCCCCCCILKPITLTTKSLYYLKLCSLQLVIIQPIVLFIAAVLWTDGKYNRESSATSAFVYITAVSTVSMLVALYGMAVVFRGTELRQRFVRLKFVPLQLVLIVLNLQSLLFNILAQNGIPGCIESRGSLVRASATNHGIIVIEAFLLSLIARRGYRRKEALLSDSDLAISYSSNTGGV